MAPWRFHKVLQQLGDGGLCLNPVAVLAQETERGSGAVPSTSHGTLIGLAEAAGTPTLINFRAPLSITPASARTRR